MPAGPHPVSLLLSAKEVVGLSQASIDSRLLSLPGRYHLMQSLRSILAHGGQPIGS
jgi:hypothetical protein